ncbi:MAG: M28 family peptidase [Burkholderiales bacterium]|nr:M28 family peptidase [Burkholderiales bacterium]
MKITLRFLSSLSLCSLLIISVPASAQKHLDLREPALRAHLAYLADDLLEGRGTGQRGGELAVSYLEAQATLLGLQPVPALRGAKQPYRQIVQILGTQTLPQSQLVFYQNEQSYSPQLGEDFLIANSQGKPEVKLDLPIVFVGYGIQAPEENWDDYKAVDVRGKLLIMMVNDPPATKEEPHRFGAEAMTYYGRWMYKFEQAARMGAAGALLIHTTESAAYRWNVPQTSFSHERFQLAGGGNAVEGWLHDAAAKKLFAANGYDLDALRTQAARRDFQPISLSMRARATVLSQVRQLTQANVIGMVPGTDAQLRDEAIVYSAHWDHLGKVEEAGKPAQIWNGAVDNATGAAALLAMAEQAVRQPTRRTQIFMWPAAEEQGLIGSLYYVRHPLWPLTKTVADLNLDSMNFVGATRDIGIAGSERSSLETDAREVAQRMGLRIAPAVPDLGGAYFRADHFNFARFGVPAFNVGSAVFSGDGHFDYVASAEASNHKMKGFKLDYHTERDRYDPRWNLSGMLQQAQFTLNLGRKIANADKAPVWKAGDPYGELRDQAKK